MIPKNVRILLATEPINMLKSFDGLKKIVAEKLREDPDTEGLVVVFYNRHRTLLKLFWYDQNGHCQLYKRLVKKKFNIPAISADVTHVKMGMKTLAELLGGTQIPRRQTRR